jgi:hypothetical protein
MAQSDTKTKLIGDMWITLQLKEGNFDSKPKLSFSHRDREKKLTSKSSGKAKETIEELHKIAKKINKDSNSSLELAVTAGCFNIMVAIDDDQSTIGITEINTTKELRFEEVAEYPLKLESTTKRLREFIET